MNIILEKYANLLVKYCLRIKPGQRVLVRTTTEAEPLLKYIYQELLKAGAYTEFQIQFSEMEWSLATYGASDQKERPSELYQLAVETFDAILTIQAPLNTKELSSIPANKKIAHSETLAKIKQTFMIRSGNGELRWTLCTYPTAAAAQEMGLSLSDYETFFMKACFLDKSDPTAEWKTLSKNQESITQKLNSVSHMQFKGPNIDLSFSVEGRRWINSDGQRNMPSGEIFSAPIENSVNGYIRFDYPIVYLGQEIHNIDLTVKDGIIEKWDAEKGRGILDELFKIPGSRQFGEVAIGTNYRISTGTKNILFDEKIGGTIHMAVGASYPETGGQNQSSVHLDFIAGMREGQIIADGKVIYEKGYFL